MLRKFVNSSKTTDNFKTFIVFSIIIISRNYIFNYAHLLTTQGKSLRIAYF